MNEDSNNNEPIVDQFLELMGETPPVVEGLDIELLLKLTSADNAKSLRLCAIPHSFTPDIISVLQPELDQRQAVQRCEQLGEFSVVFCDQDSWYLHEQVRRKLFQQWLRTDNHHDFTEANLRLSEYFQLPKGYPGQGVQDEQQNIANKHMFHLLGHSQHQGFSLFESLFKQARTQLRFAQCQSLIQLVHEYDEALEPGMRLWLSYHEGRLAMDLRQWELAESFFKSILIHHPSALPVDLRAKTTLRLGAVYQQLQQYSQARDHYQQALNISNDNNASALIQLKPNIIRHLGLVARAQGQSKLAEEYLRQSIDAATTLNDVKQLAIAYNSLGEIHRLRGDADAACDAFQQSLQSLDQQNNEFSKAPVYNNLGNACAGLLQWQRSEMCFQKSLEIKQKAGDSLGKAIAMNNLARVAIAQGKESIALDHYSQAIELLKGLRAPQQLAITTVNRARLYRRLQDTARAQSGYQQAIDIYKSQDKEEMARGINLEMASLDKSAGFPWWATISLAFVGLALLAVLYVKILPLVSGTG